MTATKKKMNTYLKFSLKLLVCVLVGGVLGFCITFFEVDSLRGALEAVSDGIRGHLLWIQALFLIAGVLINEPVLYRLRILGREFEDAEDEQGDLLEYRMEQMSALGITVSVMGIALAMILLSTGYSMDYIKSLSTEENKILLLTFGFFILNCIYSGFWQVRYVKCLQKIYPKQKGDITSLKFQKQWLESCDEAEREIIYQASYESRIFIQKMLSVLAMIAMLCHLFWDTGIMAVVMVGIIWIAMTVTYCCACVKKKGSKLNT